MTYDEYVEQLAALLVVPPDDDRFVTLLPWINSCGELGMYRDPDLDFLATRSGSDTSGHTTMGLRTAPVPPPIVVVEKVNLILPANQMNPAVGTRIPLLRASRSWLDQIWPDESATLTPAPWATYFAIQDQFNPDLVKYFFTPLDTVVTNMDSYFHREYYYTL